MTSKAIKAIQLTDSRLGIIVGLIVAAAAARLIPHPPNFTPVGAMALFAGATLADRRWAMLMPLAALFLSDLVLGSHSTLLFVYGAFVLITLLGRTLMNHRRSPLRIGGASLAASVLFFTVTNFGSWISYDWYAATPEGLLACYTAAIPFFGNTVAGDLVYSAALFGGLALIETLAYAKQPAPVLSDDA
jgi:hypothetical protein